MSPELELLAGHLSRLEPDEIRQVLERAVVLLRDRDWRSADDLRHAVYSAELDPFPP